MSYNHSCIVNDLLFTHPPCVCLSYKSVHCFTWTLRTNGHVNRFLIRHEFPKTISGDNEEFVILWVQFAFCELRLGNYTSSMSNCISKRSRHSKSWNVHVAQPNTRRPINSIIILDSKNSSSSGENSFFFGRSIRLMIMRKFLSNNFTTFSPPNYNTRITYINTRHEVAPNNGHGESCSAKFGINSKIANDLVLHFEHGFTYCFFHICLPRRMPENFARELIAKMTRYSISVFTVAIKYAQNQSAGQRVIGHNKRILILFTRIVRCVTFL
mmetsp:Transcript_2099/g.2675  ORF Transcript_2099/g.2675 Transcript_2099/m.2675 type:complete len:270 (-) Transcript_2099:525-1334(-)